MTPQNMAALHQSVMHFGTPWTAESIVETMGQKGAIVLFEAAGFALGRTIADEAELLTIAVARDRQRTGAGRRLLAAFEAEAGLSGAQDVFLEVASQNRPALALYNGAGYHEAGRRADYYALPSGRRDDALILRKTLKI